MKVYYFRTTAGQTNPNLPLVDCGSGKTGVIQLINQIKKAHTANKKNQIVVG